MPSQQKLSLDTLAVDALHHILSLLYSCPKHDLTKQDYNPLPPSNDLNGLFLANKRMAGLCAHFMPQSLIVKGLESVEEAIYAAKRSEWKLPIGSENFI